MKEPQLALRQRMREIAQVRVRYGYRRIHVLLRREGWKHSRGKTYRLYTEERLQLRSKLPKRRKMVVQRHQRMQPAAPDDAWTMDFVADQLVNGTWFRVLMVVDVCTREALAIEVGQRLNGEDVVATLDRIVSARGKPRHLFCSYYGLPFSLSMGCGTWGGNSFSENLDYRHYLNITRISRRIPAREPTVDDIFGAYLDKHGR